MSNRWNSFNQSLSAVNNAIMTFQVILSYMGTCMENINFMENIHFVHMSFKFYVNFAQISPII